VRYLKETLMAVLQHVVAPEGVAVGRGYSQVVAGRGRLVVVSGQVALDERGELVGPGDPAAQATPAARPGLTRLGGLVAPKDADMPASRAIGVFTICRVPLTPEEGQACLVIRERRRRHTPARIADKHAWRRGTSARRTGCRERHPRPRAFSTVTAQTILIV
jgi:hypothetical protein